MGKIILHNSRGQALLIVVLTMVVVLTVGLSVASRTIINLKISKQNEESQRAFQAAEAGVEQALKQVGKSLTFSQNLPNSSQFQTSVTALEGNELLINGGVLVEQGTGTDVWLSSYPDYSGPISGTVTVYWGTAEYTECGKNQGIKTIPAIEITILQGDLSSATVIKEVFDQCARIPGSSAPPVGGSVQGTTFSYSTGAISISSGRVMRVIPIFNSTKVGVTSSADFPAQGSVVESVGTSGDTVRKIIYYRSFPQIPIELFPYSILSQ